MDVGGHSSCSTRFDSNYMERARAPEEYLDGFGSKTGMSAEKSQADDQQSDLTRIAGENPPTPVSDLRSLDADLPLPLPGARSVRRRRCSTRLPARAPPARPNLPELR